jgi:hypothetical protein
MAVLFSIVFEVGSAFESATIVVARSEHLFQQCVKVKVLRVLGG